MEVKYFESEDFMGFEVKTAQDVTSAIHLGMDFINQDGDVINADFEDEDGEEREMTDTELTEDILKRIREGETVYAGTYMPMEIRVFENVPTLLASSYKVGQEVFFMERNKVCKEEICSINFVHKSNRTVCKYGLQNHPDNLYDEEDIFPSKAELAVKLFEEEG